MLWKKQRIKNKQRRQVQKLHRHVDLNSYPFSGRHRHNNISYVILHFSRCYITIPTKYKIHIMRTNR